MDRQLIYQSNHSEIFISELNGKKCILKLLNAEFPEEKQVKQFQNEFNITNSFSNPNLRKVIKSGKHDTKHALWLEYVEGEGLLKAFPNISIEEFLDVAIQITTLLVDVHQKGIIHKDLNPNNILYNSQKRQVTLIDFGISSRYDTKLPYQNNPNKLEGTLNYISPEQTGRMNRTVDFRSDLYSLGITLYQLLTTKLPFEGKDSMELIHAQISKQAVDINTHRSNTPEILNDLIQKLLEKNAENRYQSSEGLLSDFKEIRAHLNDADYLAKFQLAQNDISYKLKIPQKLYGRESELETLQKASAEMEAGAANMLLIGGVSGVGKSFLIHEVHKSLVHARGNFIQGKFDQYQRNIPYYAWIQAFNLFVDTLLTLSANELQSWKWKINNAVGSNGKVLTDVIPNLKLVIGEQDEVSELSGIEAQNRFNYVFQKFVKVIATKDYPLVIFIDDLQWADLASLNLLKTLCSKESSPYILLLGAYRSNEVDANHPFIKTTSEIQDSGYKVNTLELDNLSQNDIRQLLEETLLDGDGVEELAQLVYDKTNGNAFFVNEFIKTLYEKGLVSRSQDAARSWTWSIADIQAQNMTSNVVELMVEKVKALSDEVQALLKPMACIGNKVSIDIFEVIADKKSEALENLLQEALVEGFIYKSVRSYSFAHDRIQQAVYSLIDDNDRGLMHLSIARTLNNNSKVKERAFFDIVNQYNSALDNITVQEEREQVANLNLRAGELAQDSAAYASAKSYLDISIGILTERVWDTDYATAYPLYKLLADIEYLNGNFEQSQHYVKVILEKCKTPIEKAEIYNMIIIQHTFQSKFAEAIEIGVQALALMDEELPLEDLQNVLGGEIMKMTEAIGERAISSLIDEPLMTVREKVVATQLLVNLIPTAYLSGQMELYAIISAKIINLALQYGHSSESSHGYSNYGGVVAAVMMQYQMAYQFGELAMALNEKFNNMYLRCKDSMLFANFMSPWNKHVIVSDKINKDGFKLGLESGELQYPGYIAMFQVMKPIFRGESLKNVLEDANHYIDFTTKTQHLWVRDGILSLKAGVLNLMGEIASEDMMNFSTEEFDEGQHLKESFERMSLNSVSFYHIMKAQAAYIYGDYALALTHIESAKEAVPAIAGMIITATYNFIHSLAILAHENPTYEMRQKVYQNQVQMEKWVEACPENFLHQFLLVKAELARLEGDMWHAQNSYFAAIKSANEQGFVNNAAIANECFARFWNEQKNDPYATLHIKSAYKAYKAWGATRKLQQLENIYGKQMFTKSRSTGATLQSTIMSTSYMTSTISGSAAVDIQTIVKAAEAITSEVQIEGLMTKMVRVLVENAGADKAMLFLKHNNKWTLSTSYDHENVNYYPNGLHLNKEEYPESIVNYVQHRSSVIVLNDAAQEGKFVKDSYIEKGSIKSVLCMPMVHGESTVAILYLENNLTTNAFRADHLQLLSMLSTQIAISIQNANLYHNLELKVQERTAELNKKNKAITASINYARRIQDAVLPRREVMEQYFGDLCIYYKPRDIVSGDFYWFAHVPEVNKSILVAADCTGHGVPGAFMSMIGDSLFKQTVFDKNIYQADQILQEVHKGVGYALKQDKTQRRDGMDLALCVLCHDTGKLQFAGARNPLVYFKGDNIFTVKGDKFSIGEKTKTNEVSFTLHEFDKDEIDSFFIFSDGYQDQFGGKDNWKFMSKNLRKLLKRINLFNVTDQESILAQTFENWMEEGKTSQIDDVLVIGCKLK